MYFGWWVLIIMVLILQVMVLPSLLKHKTIYNEHFDGREELNYIVPKLEEKGYKISSNYYEEWEKHLHNEQEGMKKFPFNHLLKLSKDHSEFSIEILETIGKNDRRMTIYHIEGKFPTDTSMYIRKRLRFRTTSQGVRRGKYVLHVWTDTTWRNEVKAYLQDHPVRQYIGANIQMDDPIRYQDSSVFSLKTYNGTFRHYLKATADEIIAILEGYYDLGSFMQVLDKADKGRGDAFMPVETDNPIEILVPAFENNGSEQAQLVEPIPISLNLSQNAPNMDNCCVVCFRPVQEGINVVRMYCCEAKVHIHHLKKWLNKRNSCPSCNTKAPETILSAKLVTGLL